VLRISFNANVFAERRVPHAQDASHAAAAELALDDVAAADDVAGSRAAPALVVVELRRGRRVERDLAREEAARQHRARDGRE